MADRIGNWEYTTPFALNAFYGDFVQGIQFPTSVCNFVPVLSQFNVTGSDPSGSRHLESHASFTRTLASGTNSVDASLSYGSFNLASTDVSTGSGISCTKVFLFRVDNFDCNTSKVHNMKVWASDLSDFLTQESFRIVYETHDTWQSGLSFTASYLADKTKWLPTSVPDISNLKRAGNKSTIHGTGDTDVSQWVYIALAASGTLPLDEYKSLGSPASGFNLRVTYNIDNISAMFD